MTDALALGTTPVKVEIDAVKFAALEAEASELLSVIEGGVSLETAEDFESARELARVAAVGEDAAVALRQKATKPLGDWKKKIDAEFKRRLVDPYASVKAAATGAMRTYLERAEAERQDAVRAAQVAASAGDVAAVSEALAVADAADAGGKFVWEPRVTNVVMLAGAVATGAVPAGFVTADLAALRAHCKGEGEPAPVPGVLFERKAVVRVMRKAGT